jgi:hypothetical protein
VLIVIAGGAFGLSLDGTDTLRGWPLGIPVPKGKAALDVVDGRRAGCEPALGRTATLALAVPDIDAAEGLFMIVAFDTISVRLDAELVVEGGAEVLFRLCDIVPRVGVALIKGAASRVLEVVASEPIESVEPPRGLGPNVEALGE